MPLLREVIMIGTTVMIILSKTLNILNARVLISGYALEQPVDEL
jgi:hypothetical protein